MLSSPGVSLDPQEVPPKSTTLGWHQCLLFLDQLRGYLKWTQREAGPHSFCSVASLELTHHDATRHRAIHHSASQLQIDGFIRTDATQCSAMQRLTLQPKYNQLHCPAGELGPMPDPCSMQSAWTCDFIPVRRNQITTVGAWGLWEIHFT